MLTMDFSKVCVCCLAAIFVCSCMCACVSKGQAGLYSPGGLSACAVFIKLLYLHAQLTPTLTDHKTQTQK